jgi:hypothetical protein
VRQDLQLAERIITEAYRRWNDRWLERYNPCLKRGLQDKMHKSRARHRLAIGANGIGKTTLCVGEAGAYALGYRPWDGSTEGIPTPPNKILICVKDFKNAGEEDLLPRMDEAFPKSSLKGTEKLHNGFRHKWIWNNGSTIKIMTYNQEPMEYEGSEWDLVIFNEPPRYAIWSPVLRGINKCGGRSMFAMTPLGIESAWVHDYFFVKRAGDPDVFVVGGDLENDSFMPKENHEDFKQGIDPDEYGARVHGSFQHLQGLSYPRYDPFTHMLDGPRLETVKEFIADPSVPKGMVVDPHDRKPFAVIWFMVTPGNDIVVFREWPIDLHAEMRESPLTVSQYAEEFSRVEQEFGGHVVWRILDPNSGPKRNVITNESVSDAFLNLGYYFDHKVDDSLINGHLAVKDLLSWDETTALSATNRPRLFITPDCINCNHSFTHYGWKERGHKPGEIGKDFADCVRYLAMVDPHYFNPESLGVTQRLNLFKGAL